MVTQLAVNSTVLQVILGQLYTMGDKLPMRAAVIGGQAGGGFHILLGFEWGWSAGFEVRANIEDEGLDVVGTFLQLPQALVATRLIVKDADYHIAVQILPATRPILQDLLSLAQVHQPFPWLFAHDLRLGLAV